MQLILASSPLGNCGEEARDRRANLERETGIELLEGSAFSPSAWECDEGRESAEVFASGAETGVFKGR